MAAYIEFRALGSEKPVAFQDIDDEMRIHFGAPPSETEWYSNWYNTIAFSLALGHTWAQVLEDWSSREDIITWLKSKYTAHSYFGR